MPFSNMCNSFAYNGLIVFNILKCSYMNLEMCQCLEKFTDQTAIFFSQRLNRHDKVLYSNYAVTKTPQQVDKVGS